MASWRRRSTGRRPCRGARPEMWALDGNACWGWPGTRWTMVSPPQARRWEAAGPQLPRGHCGAEQASVDEAPSQHRPAPSRRAAWGRREGAPRAMTTTTTAAGGPWWRDHCAAAVQGPMPGQPATGAPSALGRRRHRPKERTRAAAGRAGRPRRWCAGGGASRCSGSPPRSASDPSTDCGRACGASWTTRARRAAPQRTPS
mmetsp:Transcript_11994/g.43805  ORF Transcript_11994/g.43805 Transcript_11994/m.43805 type:complete len:201 (-) Transcript_11994:115-717(-)